MPELYLVIISVDITVCSVAVFSKSFPEWCVRGAMGDLCALRTVLPDGVGWQIWVIVAVLVALLTGLSVLWEDKASLSVYDLRSKTFLIPLEWKYNL